VLPGGSKLILALDEFQWIAQSCPSLPGILQEFWDHRWKRGQRIVLILCGSYIGFMEREVLGKASPLYGRRTGQILLAPLSYREAADFHAGYSVEDRARAYFLCGGISLSKSFIVEAQGDGATTLQPNGVVRAVLV
jgi:AAA+ ATPase superfamily predicted ATPase